MNKFYFLIFHVFIYLSSFSQVDLFTKIDVEVPMLTHSDEHQITLQLNIEYFNSIKDVNPCDINIQLCI